MTTIEETLCQLLTSDPLLAEMVGDRVYPVQAPESAGLPLVIYQEADRNTVMTHDGPVEVNSYSMDLQCWGADYRSAKLAANRIRKLMLGYKGDGAGGLRILGVFDSAEQDDHEIPQHGDERGIFGVSLTLNLWFREAS